MSSPVPVVAVDDPGALSAAAKALFDGGTIMVPTDTVYGLAALPTRPGATKALFRLKDRSTRQAVAVLVSDPEQAQALCEPLSDGVRRWMDRFWPGPLTLVVPRSVAARSLVLGGDPATIGIRCPDHHLVRRLAARAGALAVTSANRHGEDTPRTAAEAAASLTGPVDLIIDGGPAQTVASTVVDVTTSTWRVLRQGALPPSALS